MSAPLTKNTSYYQESLQEAKQNIQLAIEESGVAILPPMDVMHSLRLMTMLEIKATVLMLDPWYNKGVGGVREDYKEYVVSILEQTHPVANHVFLWGFPEIVACFVERVPPPLSLVAWLTWYYKNNPSVIRGWRSAQMACLHLSHNNAKLYPEHFLNEAQKQKQAEGKLRYMPGPPSVIEVPLNIGFVGRKEQTGHPAQKPIAVFQRLYEMTTKEGDLIFDPMSGSGTTGDAAKILGRTAIICDHSEDYTRIAEKRLGIERVRFNEDLSSYLDVARATN
jgi:hypothetical protein